ncbi:methyl-coenzyme M reductase I operon protein C [Methanohalophilus portucalensis]|uniref:Methyl-coenzyme M reductase operon protein C n=2 Tax=Methanohalophilus portucalensis TaxID=39664 RepID=A0A1L9C6L1_9EURY|nr:methyl-coenzyme M reductase I operon protein C [Methanohalophilus portucalensis]ATU08735.1 methyl-coenzyme M reductase I operon protein C [Methanohalophilus portucalensis]OJH50127.1 methyl-coenzyme M reductase I operon protein C [Methanohalophilus portucalensis FDF-1]RNI13089.1 methyl-coenzyme M reductase I operon protein C [Methanohalophilus portucalensis FDF-1]SMH31301.1 methyl-coenzyme M reductase subunit C [Methanohalophilus portucalensis FDF-1]
MFDRETQVVDCRHGMGLGKGGGLAQRGTLSEAGRTDVVAVAMSPGRRHITKPICELTYGMRKEDIQVSVLVLNSGSGVPDEQMKSGSFGINPEEIKQINRHKMAVIHTGNIRDHVVRKVREILVYAEVPAVVVCQTIVDFEDFAKAGIHTRLVKPQDKNIQTKGKVMEIVTGVTRGETCPRDKLNELVKAVKSTMKSIDNKGV